MWDRCGEVYLALGDGDVRDWLLCPSPYLQDIQDLQDLQVFDPLFLTPLSHISPHFTTNYSPLLPSTTVYYGLLLSSSSLTLQTINSSPPPNTLILFDCPPSSIHPLNYLASLPNNLIGFSFLPALKKVFHVQILPIYLQGPPCPPLCASSSLFPSYSTLPGG